MNTQQIFLIEGVDNVGKSTLISNLKNHFNNQTFQTLHFSNVKQDSREKSILYNTKLYRSMFLLFKNNNMSFICDRSHIGEMVYSPIYRSYSGDYVLDIEKEFCNDEFWNNITLITLIDKADNIISRDDGLSFSTALDKKELEISTFIEAHTKSLIKNKFLFDVSSYNATELAKVIIELLGEQAEC